MSKQCAINGCKSKWMQAGDSESIPMFNLPRNNDLQNKWHAKIDSDESMEKLRQGYLICIKHFEDRFIQEKILTEEAYPTLLLKSGSTLVDYEELLAQKPPLKKRGTSGLMNLQMARKKKLMRRERMQKLAEKRRRAKLEKQTNPKPAKSKPQTVIINCDRSSDFFIGDRIENETEKVVVSLRLNNLMPHLHDNKTTLCKHPSSIRDSKSYPIFNMIKDIHELSVNPVHWTNEQVLLFLKQISFSQLSITKRFENEEIDGESILNLTKYDLTNYLKIDESSSELLSETFQQLKRETIMRYVNS